jgi:hypothetical protein
LLFLLDLFYVIFHFLHFAIFSASYVVKKRQKMKKQMYFFLLFYASRNFPLLLEVVCF